jgi:SulP family sulfate permease
VRHVVHDASAISRIDASAVDAVAEVHAGCQARNITMKIAGATTELRQRFDETGPTDVVGADHFHPTVAASVEATSQPAS